MYYLLSYEVSGLRVENSRSRSGRHFLYSTVLIYKKDQGLIPYNKCTFVENSVKPIYAKGEAKNVTVKISHGDFILHVSLVRNYKNIVKGYISVYNYRGELVYRAKYISGYVVRSKGNPVYSWIVRLFLEIAKIPVKETKLGDEK